jgi:hypothetical protein
MKIIISILSIFYSSFIYADLNFNESINHPILDRKMGLDFDKEQIEIGPNFDIGIKPLQKKETCMTAKCVDEKVVMSQGPIKDYSDQNIKPVNTGTTIEDSIEAAIKAEKDRNERIEKEEKEKK